MGRIKPAMVKRATKQLLQEKNDFNNSFENNKKLLNTTMPSKKIRNKIAGYLARILKVQQSS